MLYEANKGPPGSAQLWCSPGPGVIRLQAHASGPLGFQFTEERGKIEQVKIIESK